MNDSATLCRRAFFDHIPKTGGTACFEYFRHCLGESALSPFIMFELVPDALARHSPRILISGHFEPLPGSLPADRVTLTMLRDPIDRVLSEYSALIHDELVEPGEQFEAMRKVRRTPLLDLLLDEDPRVSIIFRNRQTRHFAGYVSTPGDITDEEALLDCAKSAISQFDVVGVHDDIEGFVDLACEALGIAIPETLPARNVTSKRIALQDLGSRERDMIANLNRADVELFRFARTRYRAVRRQTIQRLIESRQFDLGSERSHFDRRRPSQCRERRETFSHAEFGTREVEIVEVSVRGNISRVPEVFSGESATIQVVFRSDIVHSDITIGLRLFDGAGALIYGTNTYHQGLAVEVAEPGKYYVGFCFRVKLGLGEYRIGISIHTGAAHTDRCFHWKDNAGRFAVVGNIEEHFEGIANLCMSVNGGSLASAQGLELVQRLNVAATSRSLVVHSPRVASPIAIVTGPTAIVTAQPEEVLSVSVSVKNAGTDPWPSGGTRPVCCAYHVFGAGGECVLYDGLRTRLRTDVCAGETVQVNVSIVAPLAEGAYQVELDIVQESVAWFRASGRTRFPLVVGVPRRPNAGSA